MGTSIPINILVTGGGALLGQSIIRSLNKSRYRSSIKIGVADPNPLSVGLYWADNSHKIPPAKDKNFISELKKLIKTNKYKLVIPGTDAELEKLSFYKNEIEKSLNCIVLVSSEKVVEISNDKYATYKFLKSNNFNPPASCTLENLDLFLIDNQPPFIVKPRFGARSVGVYKVSDIEELKNKISITENPIIQECITNPNLEYTAGSLVFDKNCVGCILMRRDLKDGNTYRAWTQKSKILEDFIIKVSEKLNPFGPCNFQFRLDNNNEPRIFEINARFSGTTFFRTRAGFPEVEMSIKHLMFDEDISSESNISEITFLRYWNEIELDTKGNLRFDNNGK